LGKIFSKFIPAQREGFFKVLICCNSMSLFFQFLAVFIDGRKGRFSERKSNQRLLPVARAKSKKFGWAIDSFSLEGSGNLSFSLKRKVSGYLLSYHNHHE